MKTYYCKYNDVRFYLKGDALWYITQDGSHLRYSSIELIVSEVYTHKSIKEAVNVLLKPSIINFKGEL